MLEIGGQLILAPLYFELFGKRQIQSPKLFCGDAGLARYLLGIQSHVKLARFRLDLRGICRLSQNGFIRVGMNHARWLCSGF